MYNLQDLRDLSEDLSSLQPRVSTVLMDAYNYINKLEEQVELLYNIVAQKKLENS